MDNNSENRIQELLDQNTMLLAEIQRLKRILADYGITDGMISGTDSKPEYDPDQGGRIKQEKIKRQHVIKFFSRFWGREDVYSKRVVKKNGEVGYFTQCRNFWKTDFEKYGKPDYRAALIEEMQVAGFRVVVSENIQDRFAVIDKETVWYGSLDFLGKEDAEDNLMRIDSREAAEEVLAIAVSREEQNVEVL